MFNTSNNPWSDALVLSFQNMWDGIINFLPVLIIALLIILLGWLIGSIIGRVIHQLIRSLKIDEALKKAGLEDWLQRGGINLNSGHFLGGLVKWFIIIIFLIASFEVLGLSQINDFLKDTVLFYLPQVIVAVIILMAAVVIADVMQRIVTVSAKASYLKSANFLGSITKWAIWIFAILVALDQLGIAANFIQTIFMGVIIALSLSIGLAFGLGGQEAASRFIDKIRQEVSDKE